VGALLVGLTGGLASGKSTVARQLARAGFAVVDAERLVADLSRPGRAGAAAVARLFGPGLLAADGAVDKPALARRVFEDPQARARLETAIHPLVRKAFADVARSVEGVVVFEATLLVEAGYAPDFDFVVTVEAPETERLRRAVKRGLPEEEARARLLAQGSGEARRAAAHRVLVNDGDLRRLRREVARLADELRRRARTAPSA
jgi:dephospho-CoA kinase